MQIVGIPLVYAALAACIFVPLELLWPARPADRSEFGTDIAFATAGGVLTHALLAVLAGALLALGTLVGDGPLTDAPSWLALPVGLLLFELGGYAYHRAAHVLPGLRTLHAVHHSSETLDWLAGFRQHPLEIALQTLAQNLPLVLLGLPVTSHAGLAILLRLNTLFVHANVRTPAWLGHVVATPVFHHRHHDDGAEPANFATLLPWLDRLFGTFDPAGLPTQASSSVSLKTSQTR